MFDRKHIWLFILFFILGILFAYEARLLSSGIKYVGVENLQELSNQVEREYAEIAQLKAALALEQEKLAIYEEATTYDTNELVEQLNLNIEQLEETLHQTDVAGPGVIVIIDDAKRDLYQGEDGNNVLVHDRDIGIIIEELRQAGAEAISINGERVIYNDTRIVCVGPTVKVNGEQMSAPFIIKAIGNKKYLEAVINAPGTYSEILASYGLFVEVNTSVSVVIDQYEGIRENTYMNYYEEGED